MVGFVTNKPREGTKSIQLVHAPKVWISIAKQAYIFNTDPMAKNKQMVGSAIQLYLVS